MAIDPSPSSRRLYIDLLARIVANTIYRDPPQEPWSAQRYSDDARRSGRDWPSMAHTMIGTQRIENLRELCESVVARGIPGDLIETGVWRGGACILMRGILAAYGDTTRRVIVADSFEGLPPPRPDLFPADDGDTHHTYPQLAISEAQVRENFAAYGLLDGQVEFLKGWFRDTLPSLKGRRFALLRLDGDMYESTMDALENLYGGLSDGGFVIVDDYGCVPGCKAAVDDFRARHGIVAPITMADWTGAWWQK